MGQKSHGGETKSTGDPSKYGMEENKVASRKIKTTFAL